jgi:heme exporter protein C
MRYWQLAYDDATKAILWTPLVLGVLVVALLVTHVIDAPARKWVWKALAGIAAVMFLVQPYLALTWAPPEQFMGDTGRIIYMHVPQLEVSMLALTLNFCCALAFLFSKSFVADALAEATAEVGVYFGGVGVLLGSIWAKPTWGAWWTWDPRLTTSAILLVIYFGYLAMRRFVEDPEKRATWSAVMGIIAYVDVPVLWFSVKWWKSIHQVQSPAAKFDSQMNAVWRWSTVMFIALAVVFIYQRFKVAYETRSKEVALPSTLPEAQEA